MTADTFKEGFVVFLIKKNYVEPVSTLISNLKKKHVWEPISIMNKKKLSGTHLFAHGSHFHKKMI